MFKKIGIVIILIIIGTGLILLSNSLEKEGLNKPLVDNQNLYVNDQVDVKEVYITILPDESQEYVTFAELNENIYDDIAVKVLFQEGRYGLPRVGYYGYSLTDANGVMELRGQSTRKLEQKSYKINLKKKAGLWDGYEIINLNKHSHDNVKIRNKLNFDLFKEVSNITSLETRFVHVYIKDYSEGDYSQEFVDYGLFTQIENVDEDFLKRHNLDKDGWLYKVENFEFYRYPDYIKNKEDVDYSEDLFEEILEIKGNDDHSKLITMLNDVNNPYKHINDVIEEHFDRENYLTWLGYNILVGNIDTMSRNFFLYSPIDYDTWYILPWDYDGTFGWYDKQGSTIHVAPWQEGVSNYWGVVLHRRFLENDSNREDLTNKIEELSDILTEEKILSLLHLYEPIISEFITREPDKRYSVSEDELEDEFKRIASMIEINKEKYYRSLDKPMPMFMGEPDFLGDYLIFRWDSSYDFQGDDLQYSLSISTTPDFNNIIYYQDGIRETEYIVKGIGTGHYYWKLEVIDSDGNKQIPFDIYQDENGNSFFGVKEFVVN